MTSLPGDARLLRLRSAQAPAGMTIHNYSLLRTAAAWWMRPSSFATTAIKSELDFASSEIKNPVGVERLTFLELLPFTPFLFK